MRGTTYLDLNLEFRYVDTRGVRTEKNSDKFMGPTVESELLDDRPNQGLAAAGVDGDFAGWQRHLYNFRHLFLDHFLHRDLFDHLSGAPGEEQRQHDG